MVDLVLHPGHSKCGSTTIQNFLYKNRQKLKNRGAYLPDCNFNFPNDDEYKFHLTHTPRDYFAKIQGGELQISDLEGKLNSLVKNAQDNGCKRVIISAENLINGLAGKDSITRQIHRMLGGFFDDVKIVYYVRRQDKFLVSAWQQWGHKEGLELEEYIERLYKGHIADYLFNANQLLNEYPANSLRVRPIDKIALINGCLLEDFCARSSILTDGLDFDIPNSNVGLSVAMCETLSRASEVYQDIHDQTVKRVIEQHSLTGIAEKKYSPSFSNNMVKKLVEQYQEKNVRLANRFFPKVDFEKTMDLNSLVGSDSDDILLLKERVTKLEDVCAAQMDMIISLAKRIN
ncbi:hypothetical protein ACVFI8_02545 [Agarivorans sp. MS3-6]